MGRLLLILFFILPLLCHGQEWKLQDSGTIEPLHDIYFISATHGWAVGGVGTILRTTDGGANWEKQTTNTASGFIQVQFIDSANGWSVTDHEELFRSYDGGATWELLETGTFTLFNRFFFLNENLGWGLQRPVGIGKHIVFKTTDGGHTWQPLFDSLWFQYSDINFLDEDNGLLVGGQDFSDVYNKGRIYRTSNGGQSWEMILEGTGPLFQMDVYSPEIFAVCGWDHFYRPWITTNGGNKWYVLQHPAPAPIFASHLIEIADTSLIFVAAGPLPTRHLYSFSGTLAYGKENQFEEPGVINEIFFIDKEHGWCVGDTGKIWTYKEVSVGVSQTIQPEDITLGACFPNPVGYANGRRSIVIPYTLRSGGHVTITVYNSAGIKVKTLMHEAQTPGTKQVFLPVSDMQKGVYFYELQFSRNVKTTTKTKKFVIQ